jgi:beta-carotene hydroxylase
MLNYKADLRSCLYMLLTSFLLYYQWNYGFNIWIYIVYLFFSISVSVMTHNHQHLNMWKSKFLNILTDLWLTVFYGVPIYTWIPTHNRNHHKYVNREGDVTATYRHTEENDLLSLLSYPSVSGYNQIKESIVPYMKKLKETDKSTYYQNVLQMVVLAAWILGFLILDWQQAILYIIIPQQVSAFTVLTFNYVQHVHADEESKYNHSRNFMGLNLLLFNNGYHTAHHERAAIHWSLLPDEHAKIANEIDKELIEKTFLGFIFRSYIMGSFNKKYKTFNRRQARIEQEGNLVNG